MAIDSKKKWKVGELAKLTGLTVRTLQYYDQFGLLTPSQETEGGHRLYTRSDLEKLQKILTLKQINFSLDEIKEAVNNPEFSIKEATSRLREDLKKRKAELEDIDARLSQSEKFQKQEDLSTDTLVQLLSRMNLMDGHLEKEQIEWINEHGIQFGSERLDEMQKDWVKATADLQRAISEKLSPSDWKTKAICMRWFGLACSFMGDSFDGVYELKKIVEEEPKAAIQLGIPGADLGEIFDFVELVLKESLNHPIPRALGYVYVGVTNIQKSKVFYDRVLSHLEMSPIFHRPNEIIYGKTNPEFFIGTKTNDDEPMSFGNAVCIGFWADSIDKVDSCYAEAMDAGATCYGKPKYESRQLYSCYVEDPDGNLLEIMKWFDDPEKPTG